MSFPDIIEEFPQELRTPVLHLVAALREEQRESHEDFSELKKAVRDLVQAQQEFSQAQKRTEERVEEIALAQQDIVVAQKRTEERVEEIALAQQDIVVAQKRTEERVEEIALAQRRTEERVGEIALAQQDIVVAQKRTEERVEEIALAQKRTEERVEDLALAQKETVRTMHLGFKEIRDSISALGSRWGIQNEATMRNTLQGVLGETNYSVKRGYYGNREVDIVIRGDGAHILLEVTAALKSSDIPKYIASADDYEAQTGVTPKIMVAAPHIPPPVIKAIMRATRPIELFSADDEL